MTEYIETNCAVIRESDGLVMNIIVATPSDLAPDKCYLVEVMNGQLCNIGWYYIDNDFKSPRSFAMCNETTNDVVSLFSISYVSPIPLAPDGYYIVEVPSGLDVGIGWTWDGSQFNQPVG